MKGIFVICANGLGHFRRSIRVAHALKQVVPKLQLTIYCHPAHLKTTKGWEILEALKALRGIQFIDLTITPTWQTDNTQYTEEMLLDWYKTLPKKEFLQADFVVSDNMPQILNLNPDTILMGSFLWAEILLKQNPDLDLIKRFHEEELNLLKQYTPKMVCLKDMAMNYVINYTSPVYTAWVVENTIDKALQPTINNILLAPGGTPHAHQKIGRLITELSNCGKYNIYIPSRLIASFPPNPSIKPFDFSLEEFKEIDLMITRPGIGAITDAVSYQIPLIAVGEDENPELEHNASRVASLGFGVDSYHSSDVSIPMIEELDRSSCFLQMQATMHKAKKSGIEETVNFLVQHCNLPCVEGMSL